MPDPSERRPCRTCRAQMSRILGPKGKYIPVQQVRQVYRIRACLPGMDGGPPVLEEALAGALFVNHFETCPDAAEHSRRAQRKERPHA